MSREAEELEKWIKAHPVQANLYAIGILVLVFEVGMILLQLLKYVSRQ